MGFCLKILCEFGLSSFGVRAFICFSGGCSPVWSRSFLTPRHEFCFPLLWVLSSVWSRCSGPLRRFCFSALSFGEAGLLGFQAHVVFFPCCGSPHFVKPVFLGLWTNLFFAVHSLGRIAVFDSWGPVCVDAASGLWKFCTNIAVSIVGRLSCRLSFTSFFTFSLYLSLITLQPPDFGHFVFAYVTLCLFFWLLFASSPCCPSDVPSFLHGLRVRPLAWPWRPGSHPDCHHVLPRKWPSLNPGCDWLSHGSCIFWSRVKQTSARYEMRSQTGGVDGK